MTDRVHDPLELGQTAMYRLLTSLIVPRPIAWVSTLSDTGVRNLAPLSYFNLISTQPPVVHITVSGEKDTLHNIRASGEFVINTVTRDLVEAMNLTAAPFPPGEDEFRWAGLEEAASTTVKPPRVAAAVAAMECRLHSSLTIGNGTMLFGEVLLIHTSEQLWDGGEIPAERLPAVGRLSGSAYADTTAVFRLVRPTWDEVRAAHGGAEAGKD